MDNWKEELQKYLSDVEKFLTSVLLEETQIEIASSETVEHQAVLDNAQKSDLFLYTRDDEHNADCIIILEEEWLGLLSSIMLGVEEKKHNEITRDLLKKFSSELSVTMVKRLADDDYATSPQEIQVLTHAQVEKVLSHTEYFFAQMDIDGVADDKVRAAFLIGNPEALIQQEEPEEEPAESDEKAEANPASEKAVTADEEDFTSVDAGEMERLGQMEDIISGRNIEFEDFDEPANGNGHQNGSRSMDLLKDVEMDVAVELGRIELPLGKVLQLAKGSVIELEKLAGEPVDILVNGHCIAQGEVVVIDEHFGVRIENLVTTRQRIAKLQ